ncbi:MAG TPA: signal peptidase II [Ktedonobacterales bacterium]|nr:signal peptidase II [Ktedonobacterales bacterium]
MKLSRARRHDALMVALALTVIAVDQLTKHWIVQYFRIPGERAPIQLVGPILTLDYIQNRGVAFSLLEGQSVLFFFIAIAIVVIGSLYWRVRDTGTLALKLTFGLVLGGAAGNLIDRIRNASQVVDFIHFQIPNVFNFAVFNVADSAISLGVIALAYLLWRGSPAERDAAATPSAPARRAPDAKAATPRVRNPRARAR